MPTFVEASFAFELRQVQRSYPLRMAARGGTRLQTSRNWSGAFITPRDGRMFTEVHGSWTVPLVSAASGVTADNEYRSSTWIGLDGQRRYLHSSLPQIGTAQFVNVHTGTSTLSTTSWWQWWLRDHSNPPVTLSLTVNPYDEVIASLIVVGETLVKFIIKNVTTGQVCSPFIRSAPTATMPNPPSLVQVRVSGATAEWVVERPTALPPADFLYDLPDYGTVDFSDCHAVSALAPQGTGRAESLVGARLINMYKVESNPHRTVIISRAERPDVDRVKTTYTDG